jgi:hypothetical protein
MDGVDNGGVGDTVDDWQNSPDWPWPKLVIPIAGAADDR